MHIDMDQCSHAEMTVECKRLGYSKKTINDRIAKVIQVNSKRMNHYLTPTYSYNDGG